MTTVANKGPGGAIRVRLCEIERGLFRANCQLAPGTLPPPDHPSWLYQVSPDPEEAQRLLEQAMRGLGYETVIWEPAHL